MSAITNETRPENLAAIFQEILTAVVRLRAGRQVVSDGQLFRTQIREALNLADRESRQRGYSADTIRLATFAVVAFLDESVLNQQIPVFSDWMRKPLQQEMFGIHVGGEVFFQELQGLLAQADSSHLGDLLEVYQLCLLLGYRGRYGAAGSGELRAINEAIANKIGRNRTLAGDFSPAWRVPGEALALQPDVWVRRLSLIFAACLVLTLLFFGGYMYSLGSGMSALEAAASQLKR